MRRNVLELFKPEKQEKLSDFELFWECYPRKKSKGDALLAWDQVKSVRPPIEEIVGKIEQNFAQGVWREAERQYIPYPATWLRDWGWADEE